MAEIPELIVGLGNPGAEHARDRHNVGYWFVEAVAASFGGSFKADRKLQGESCRITTAAGPLRLLKPTTYMNLSGQSVRQALDYYKVDVRQVLVVHDDIDLPPGVARFKRGGGHGGNNGLRDVIRHCGRDFLRLRIGVGHPGRKEQVVGYVLRPPGADDLVRIEQALQEAQRALDVLLTEGLDRATTALHTATPRESQERPGDT